MSVYTWWPLFPLLFFIVLTCLITALVRLYRTGSRSWREWLPVSLALLFYSLTFALGHWPWLHMPMSNLAELAILFNIVYFFRKRIRAIAWLNVVALLAIGADFALHFILK